MMDAGGVMGGYEWGRHMGYLSRSRVSSQDDPMCHVSALLACMRGWDVQSNWFLCHHRACTRRIQPRRLSAHRLCLRVSRFEPMANPDIDQSSEHAVAPERSQVTSALDFFRKHTPAVHDANSSNETSSQPRSSQSIDVHSAAK